MTRNSLRRAEREVLDEESGRESRQKNRSYSVVGLLSSHFVARLRAPCSIPRLLELHGEQQRLSRKVHERWRIGGQNKGNSLVFAERPSFYLLMPHHVVLQAVSTNMLYYSEYRLVASMGSELGAAEEPVRALTEKATLLKVNIRQR